MDEISVSSPDVTLRYWFILVVELLVIVEPPASVCWVIACVRFLSGYIALHIMHIMCIGWLDVDWIQGRSMRLTDVILMGSRCD